MQFISEDIIDNSVAKMDQDPEENDRLIALFAEEQHHYFSFISGDNFKMLTSEEFDLLLFMSVVIWQSIKTSVGSMDLIDGSEIESCEEANWELQNSSKSKKFSVLVDQFFEDYPQEDLLAFVEDSLQHDPDQDIKITQVGKELIFISCKSFIDAAELRYD